MEQAQAGIVSVTLYDNVAQEVLIALRDRAHTLKKEVADGASGKPGAATIAAIADRQLTRVRSAGYIFAQQLGERF